MPKKAYTVSIDPDVKEAAQKAAKGIWMNLSQVIELSLRKFTEDPTLESLVTKK